VLLSAPGISPKYLPHLLRRAEIIGGRRHAHARRVAQQAARLDCQHDVLVAGIFRLDVMHIICGYITRLVPRPQLDQRLVDLFQLGDIVLLQLQKEVVAAENFVIPIQLLACRFHVPLGDQPRHFGAHAPGGADQPLAVLRQQLVVDPRIIIKAIQLRCAGKLQQVAVTGLVLGDQQQVGGLLILPAGRGRACRAPPYTPQCR
jgi:hypothetical protein